jgi:UDP-N-acetylglucosamine 2-epimerase (non-hydrolysing)
MGIPMARRKIMLVFGTRPEIIKLGPVIEALRCFPEQFEVVTVATGQHREMLEQALRLFGIVPDFSFDVMRPNQNLCDLTGDLLTHLKELLERQRPDLILVQGDTTTAFCGALAAYYHKISVGHVEAGLRSGDKFNPYPEEINRTMIGAIADWHFAPTEGARENLIKEGVRTERVFVTGNTVVDALLRMRERSVLPAPVKVSSPDKTKTIVMTCHRRESFGDELLQILDAAKEIAERNPEVIIVYPLHPNPNVAGAARKVLSGMDRVRLVEPMDYLSFLGLLESSYLILSDSGGVQEEAPSLRKPILVMRKTTERPEGIAAGIARLVGTETDVIVREAELLLRNPEEYRRRTQAVNPYGDGKSGEKIARIILEKILP